MLSELRARWTKRDLASGLHQGQRPSAPRKQAGKMTAPDRSSAQSNFTLAAQGPSKDDSTPRGQVTKLKLVKRQMYGRAKLDLLEARPIGPGRSLLYLM